MFSDNIPIPFLVRDEGMASTLFVRVYSDKW